MRKIFALMFVVALSLTPAAAFASAECHNEQGTQVCTTTTNTVENTSPGNSPANNWTVEAEEVKVETQKGQIGAPGTSDTYTVDVVTSTVVTNPGGHMMKPGTGPALGD